MIPQAQANALLELIGRLESERASAVHAMRIADGAVSEIRSDNGRLLAENEKLRDAVKSSLLALAADSRKAFEDAFIAAMGAS